MSDEKRSEVARKLELLKQRFKEKATADLDQLQATIEKIVDDDCTIDDIASIYQALHRLAGSAGTFGYTALGEGARRLELALKPHFDEVPKGIKDTSAENSAVRFSCADLSSGIADLRSLLQYDSSIKSSMSSSASQKAALKQAKKSVIQIVDSSPDRAQELAMDLKLHGYQIVLSESLAEAEEKPVPGLSAIIVRATLVVKGNWKLNALAAKAPVICISSWDSFEKRYRLARLGASGFLFDPIDVPVLADYIERLIAEREDGESGRVMIVDDDRELLEHYGLVLERGGFEVFRVNDPSNILVGLSEFRPDIVLMDIQMGDFNGPNLARMLRFDQEWLGLPIIYLSSEEDREFQLEAMSKGGDDFLTKPVSDAFLLRAVTVRCDRARQLDKLASRDSLTGLLKHSLVKSEVQKVHARCQRAERESVVAMLDLDHFKRVNDQYGHRAGDLVIKGVASLLRHRLRNSDVLGRYGGEEFMVALPDCSLKEARSVLQSVCDQFSQIVFTGAGEEFTVTLSVGVAPLCQFATSDDAIEAADRALYQRKRSGRNGVTVVGDQ